VYDDKEEDRGQHTSWGLRSTARQCWECNRLSQRLKFLKYRRKSGFALLGLRSDKV
jgi:hypothetical protein